MAPTFLIIGATGNTGRSTVTTLSELIQKKEAYSNYRILALTRSASNPIAQQLAKLPNVQLEEKKWVDITPEWLQEHNVERAFIASHVQPNHFAEESTFLVAALNAGVKYVVRISTTAPNVRPDTPVYYARMHWAIEAMLSTPEFERLKWTALQPNAFIPLCLWTAADFVNNFRKTGKQDTLKLISAKDVPVGVIHPDDIGDIAAHLLADDDFAKHNKARYVLNGPEDITGEQIVQMVEEAIGTKVEKVEYKDMSLVDAMVAAASTESPNVIGSIRYAQDEVWKGKASASTTSKEIAQMGLLRRTAGETFKALLGMAANAE